jgi:7-cyano-7-deazaguanine synthase
VNYACTVLLSGGLDSVAALHWAMARHKQIDALAFDYGQANRDGELAAAGKVARRRSVPLTVCMIGHAVRGDRTLRRPLVGVDGSGVSLANLAARNAVFLSCAARHAAGRYPGAKLKIVIGCNADDAVRFPDCRVEFIQAAASMLSAALVGVVESVDVLAPWVSTRKAGIVRWAHGYPEAIEDIGDSMSCYGGDDCGVCDACTLRASAFGDAKAAQAPRRLPVMIGGDPQRGAKR